MTIKELKASLSRYPEDSLVYLFDTGRDAQEVRSTGLAAVDHDPLRPGVATITHRGKSTVVIISK